jgi:uncharacterized protein YodC (DUF2158 family)
MKMENFNDMKFYAPGDLVKVRHDIDYVPTMFVTEKMTRNIRNKDGEMEQMFLGIKCRWFNANGDLQEAVFNTKDLMKVD